MNETSQALPSRCSPSRPREKNCFAPVLWFVIDVSPGESGSSVPNLGNRSNHFVIWVRRLRNVDLGDLSGLIGRSTIPCPLPSSSCRRPGQRGAGEMGTIGGRQLRVEAAGGEVRWGGRGGL